MLQRLRHRAQGQEGFTLIELLVVILIIGILAGVAIPVFLNQTGKANDANIKSDINSAATAEETYYTDHQYYTGTFGDLTAINPALTNASASSTATSSPGDSMTIAYTPVAPAAQSASTGYTISATDNKGINFTYTRAANGQITRQCTVPSGQSTAGCSGTTAGSSTPVSW